ncbi:LTA synthase family protein [Aquimarina sp. W85]|uniref:LTA synthase family protein n=1 Tax=Aquimarina rhodophyticola TaxID=3342246 RepID=UPI003673389F
MTSYLSHIKLLGKRLLLVTALYQICRILFFLFNFTSFSKASFYEFLGGIRFDLSTIAYTNLIIIIAHTIPGNFKDNILYQKIVKRVYFGLNAIFIATNFIDMEYYKFTGKRSSYGMITAQGMENEITGLVFSFMTEFWYILLILVLLLFLFWKLIPTSLPLSRNSEYSLKHIIITSLSFIAIITVTVIIGRGGTQRKPLKRVDAIQYGSAQTSALVLNTPFSILKTLSKKEDLSIPNYFNPTTLAKYFNPIKTYTSKQPFTKKNVVIIILESFGNENIGSNLSDKSYTPFLDSLITQSLFFRNGFANGRLSIDAVPSILSSIPSLMNNNFIQSTYAFNKIKGLPKILKEQGYHTSFFHGAFNGSQNFDQYAKISGFDAYYGKNEYPYPGGEDGRWGIFDEEFLQFFGEKLANFKAPFFTTLFTISSHNPYIIPEKYKNRFPKGTTKIHESIGYTDYALSKFFDRVKHESWYKNTLFVLSADHTSAGGKGFYNTSLGKLSIPILFFDPSNNELKGTNDKNFQQIDILPTILEYLNYEGKILSFGNSLSENDRMIACYQNNAYHFVKKEYYLIFDGNKTLGFYNWKKDSMQTVNISETERERRIEFEKQAKAYIQCFNSRVVNNQLTLD